MMSSAWHILNIHCLDGSLLLYNDRTDCVATAPNPLLTLSNICTSETYYKIHPWVSYFQLFPRYLLFIISNKMVLQLVGAPTSWNTLRARHVLFEKGLYDIELVYLDLANGDHKVDIPWHIIIRKGRLYDY